MTAVDVVADDVRAGAQLGPIALRLAIGTDAPEAGGSLDLTQTDLSNAGTPAATSANGRLTLKLTGVLANSGRVQVNGAPLGPRAASRADRGEVLDAGSGPACVAAAAVVRDGHCASNGTLGASGPPLPRLAR